MNRPPAAVSQILVNQYQLPARPGAKVTCPFCHHPTLSIKPDDTLAKCFHPTCGRFITPTMGVDSISLAGVLAEMYVTFHQDLLRLKDAPYENAYDYLVHERKIHPRVIEDSMLGSVPSGGYDVDAAFQPLFDALGQREDVPQRPRGRPRKNQPAAQTLEERRQELEDIKERLRACLLKRAGWLAFFYTDMHHRIVAIRFRRPYSKNFVYFKPYKTVAGLFGHGLFAPYELNGLQALNQYLLVTEGEFNSLQVQSLLVRRVDEAGKDPAYMFACSTGGADNADWPMVSRLAKKPILAHDHDEAGLSWVEHARQLMAVRTLTTPRPSNDLDEFIRSFGHRTEEAWAAVKALVTGSTTAHRQYSGRGFEFFNERRFVPKLLGDAIMERLHLKFAVDTLWVYRDGVYYPDGELAVKREAHALLGPERKEGYIQEVLRYIEVETASPAPELSGDFINLRNGRLHWRTGELHVHTPKIFEVIQLPFNYDPTATCPHFDRYCETTFCKTSPGKEPEIDHKIIDLIEETIGHCTAPDRRYEKTFMFLGEGENGKSVLLDLLTRMLGSQNVSNVALQDLTEDRFATAQLLGKLANIFADLDSRAIESTTAFKMLTTGDEIEAQRKFGHRFKFRNYAQMLFSANEMPKSKDRTYAFYRRWVIIPFTRTFRTKADGRDEGLREKLYAEIPGIFNRALRGLRRLSEQRAFTIPQMVEEALSTYQQENDTITAFAKECLKPFDTGQIEKVELYNTYKRWCAREGYTHPANQREVKRTLTKLFPKLDEYRGPGGRGRWKWVNIAFSENAPLDEDGIDDQ